MREIVTVDIVASVQRWSNVGISALTFPPKSCQRGPSPFQKDEACIGVPKTTEDSFRQTQDGIQEPPERDTETVQDCFQKKEEFKGIDIPHLNTSGSTTRA